MKASVIFDSQPARRSYAGFTMVEVIVAMTIGVVVLGFVSVFFVDALKVSLGVTNNLDIENSIRKITDQLSSDAREANSFVIYKTFYDEGHGDGGSFRNPAEDTLVASYRMQAGESGNCCVFVYNGEDLTPLDLSPAPIERIVGYYLNDEEGSEAIEIKRFDIDIPTAQQANAVEDLIPAALQSSQHTVLVESATGLISGDLFYNMLGRSIVINSEIIYDLPSKNSGGTYNFTVSPRG
ncbi:prepilin-type N-terminal cleavage/methylation domain-containing protein [Coraliomargarita sp. SDUM461003]|uniref:Prepilin-type N-terminal cleavage/methylation domain-containing protein n=1 Tax=Thalassobacterium maritimum TaxID=3041265 RepID=A0ABU1AYU9_9BACT|nr:prepilin-type N-terminal cleavage/methylation domain-containing protein [Coraliomargarita sp. SDUM461003]MDQ8209339.1 prepilin-type N-terminal cleavage/methylation domain-containing protein [Coraliomargarita sp. SDUM461003]